MTRKGGREALEMKSGKTKECESGDGMTSCSLKALHLCNTEKSQYVGEAKVRKGGKKVYTEEVEAFW